MFSTRLETNNPDSTRITLDQLEGYFNDKENDFYHFRMTLDGYSKLVFDAIIKGL